ncbi:hypothetical protein MKEN_01097600 [Mycena kentingensis (nom. inval.)]|nr:hypothetical protein MKEN_01097600 [Mycena kentingensis (nom. inval.)]
MNFTLSWPKKRPPIPFEASTSLELPLSLPTPTVQCPSSPRKLRFRSRWGSIRDYVKRTLAAPSSTPLVDGFEFVSDPALSPARKDTHELVLNETEEVDEVVVDRTWGDEFGGATETDSDAAETASSRHDMTVADTVDTDGQPTRGIWAAPPFSFVRTRIWPRIKQFYWPRFDNDEEERAYQKEQWQVGKRLSLWASLFFIANCILAALLIQDPIVLADKIFYYGISPLLAVPIFFMCAYNFPHEHPLFFQCFLVVSTWSWPFYEVLFAFLCGFYSRGRGSSVDDDAIFTCGNKDFLSTFFYTSALQVVALFGTSLKRLPATLGALAFLIFISVAIVPLRHDYVRNVINFVIFESVLLYMHSQKEQSARKLFKLRTQLKLQFERTSKAQVNERQAADSKRRLTSYVFHDMSAFLSILPVMLAVQNMASRPIAHDHEVEFSALEGSLSMMSKVLNDVLDFNRMDSGRLESLSKPYAFHKVLRSLFIPLRLAADARQLEFVTDLDIRIDEVARRAAYQAMDATPEAIAQHLLQQPNGEGVVVGDETRLRQIITNLASNACKFTPAGGKLTIRTRLVLPASGNTAYPTPPPPPVCTYSGDGQSLTATALTLHNEMEPPHPKLASPTTPLERIVVRIEVTDTGSGILPKDMVECKLFSAFNQTALGREQGGKGTGLGLALVRQIVKLSGGRLGLQSKVGVGSTFWVELPLGVGRKAMDMGPGTPSSLAHNAAPQYPIPSFPGHGANPNSIGSSVEAVDAATKAASQSAPTSARSESALHGLMDQGGRFELMLSKYDSHSPAPTRTLGDASTGTEYPLVASSAMASPVSEIDPLPELVSPATPGQMVESTSGSTSTTVGGDTPGGAEPETPNKDMELEQPEGAKDNTLRPRRVGADVRPTFVPIPGPQSFGLSSLPSASSTGSGSAPHTPSGLRVLVVDDDALTRMLMTRMLERMGCRVSTAENGEVALQRILAGSEESPAHSRGSAEPPPVPVSCSPATTEGRYAIIFLDNQMPKLSGVKVVERLRAMGRSEFVVGVTGNALLTDQKEYLDAGADHVLTKPVLEASLRKMLALADARRR